MLKRKVLKHSFLIGILLAMTALAIAATAGAVTGAGPVVSNVIPADGATVYTNGTTTVTSISADYAPGSSGSPIDPTMMDAIMVHLDGSNMLSDCPTMTATHVACNATVADLPAGAHTLDVYVMDIAGNLTVNHTSFNVVVDNVAPGYTNLSPAGGSTIHTSSLTGSLLIEADYSDPAPSSGIASSYPMIHVNDGPGVTGAMIMMGCVKTANHYSCPAVNAKLLKLGVNQIEFLLKDNVGNTNKGLASSINYYTVVDDVAPQISNISANATTISATYSDPSPAGALSPSLASGINSATAAVKVDGTAVNGCTPTANSVSCPTPAGLTAGTHTVSISVADNSGNTGSGSGSLGLADTVAPTVSGVAADAVTISASYSDPAPSSGIDTASVVVYFDGAVMSGCAATGSPSGTVSCPALADPGPGTHTINVYITDISGNTGSGSGTYFIACMPAQPGLSLSAPDTRWASYQDWLDRKLSVTWTVTNTGSDHAHNVYITGSAPGGGVSLLSASALPVVVAPHLMPTESGSVVLQYNVPQGVLSFHVDNTASAEDECGNQYTYK